MRLDQAVTFRSTFAVRDLSFQRRKRPRRSRPREPWRRRCIEERVSGSIVSEHVYNPSDRWDLIRRRLYSSGSPEPALWCLRDGLDPVAIIDSSANVLERYGYEAFGPVRFMDSAFAPRSASAHAWTWLFHAEFIDPETGLYNYGYRYYHPQLGRWISRDPIGEEGGANLYRFVSNNGTNHQDAYGLDFISAGSRPLEALNGFLGGENGVANHASLDYFEEEEEGSYRFEDQFSGTPPETDRTKTVELLQYPNRGQPPYGWVRMRIRQYTPARGQPRRRPGIETVGISGISHRLGGGVDFIVVKPCAKPEDWEEIVTNANHYLYAEPFDDLERGEALTRWPSSKYEFPPFGNNSNTFVREMLRQAGYAIPDFMNTTRHPGARFPGPVWEHRSAPVFNPQIP